MAATPVPSFTAPPDFPALSDRAAGTYNSKAFAWATAWQGTTGPNVYAIANTAYLNAQEAAAQTATAVTAAASAENSAASAAAAANFKDFWANLTGPLNKPASVKHGGRFWYLLQNVADVTAHEPAENAYWTSATTGTLITQQVTGNVNPAVPGVTYIFCAATATVTLPLPESLAKGDGFGFRVAVDLSPTQKVKLNGAKLFGKTVEDDEVYMDVVALEINFEDNTYGYI